MSLIAAVFLSSLDPAPSAGSQAPGWTSCSSIETGHGPLYVDLIAYVFFDTDSSIITAQGASMLDSFVTGYNATGYPPHCQAHVLGTADRAGSADHNLLLSRRRANAVVAYLRRKGLTVPIVVEWRGETRLLVETADGVAERQNRYVAAWVTDPPPSSAH